MTRITKNLCKKVIHILNLFSLQLKKHFRFRPKSGTHTQDSRDELVGRANMAASCYQVTSLNEVLVLFFGRSLVTFYL